MSSVGISLKTHEPKLFQSLSHEKRKKVVCNAGKTGHFKFYTHWAHFSCILHAVWSLCKTDCVLSGGLPPVEIFVKIVPLWLEYILICAVL